MPGAGSPRPWSQSVFTPRNLGVREAAMLARCHMASAELEWKLSPSYQSLWAFSPCVGKSAIKIYRKEILFVIKRRVSLACRKAPRRRGEGRGGRPPCFLPAAESGWQRGSCSFKSDSPWELPQPGVGMGGGRCLPDRSPLLSPSGSQPDSLPMTFPLIPSFRPHRSC